MGVTSHASGRARFAQTACSLYPRAIVPAARPYRASGSLLAPPTGRGLPSRKATRAGYSADAARRRCSTARHSSPIPTVSIRRLIVEPDGIRWGRRRVDFQLAGSHAQETGRSWRAAQSMVSTSTQPGIWTYFWLKSRATSRTARYNTGQSSRSMAHLLYRRCQGSCECAKTRTPFISGPCGTFEECWSGGGLSPRPLAGGLAEQLAEGWSFPQVVEKQ